MARRARCGWVRSVLTQEVKAIAAAKPRIDAVCPTLTSGHLPWPWIRPHEIVTVRPEHDEYIDKLGPNRM